MFKKKNILITGVGKGIGKELMIHCIKNNYFVYGICRSKSDYKDLLKYKNNSTIFFGDVTNEKFINSTFSYFKKKRISFSGLVNNAGEIDPVTAAETAGAVGVRIYTIGIGSDGSIRRAVPGVFGTRYQNVEVEIDEETLRTVAKKTGGKYYRATSEKKLEQIYDEIGELERTEITSEIHVEYTDRYMPLLWAGLFLLLCEVLLSNTRFRSLP